MQKLKSFANGLVSFSRFTFRVSFNLSKVCLLFFFLHYFAKSIIVSEYHIGRFVSVKKAEAMEVVGPVFGYAPLLPEIDALEAEHMAEHAALEFTLAPSLVRALLHTESRTNGEAVSEKGAVGYGQIMPFNAARCGITKADLKKRRQNIKCSAQILSEDIDSQGGSVIKGLQQYNGGPKCVKVIERCGSNLACMGYESPKKRGCGESYLFAQNVTNKAARDIR